MESKKKWTLGSALKIAIPIGAVQFGTLCGPAMASGAYANQYFNMWGSNGLLMLLVYSILTGIGLFVGMMLVTSHKAYNYMDFYGALYGPKIKRWAFPVLDVYAMCVFILSAGSCISMGGTIMNTLCGWNPLVGSIIFAIVGVALVVYGAPLLRKASTAMTIILLAGFLIMIFLAMKLRGGDFITIMADPGIYKTWGVGAISLGWVTILQYSWLNMNGASLICSLSQDVRNMKDVTVVSIVTPIMTAILFLMTILITLPFMPEILTESMPILAVCVNFIKPIAPWVTAIYYIVMIFALISTIPIHLFSAAARWAPVIFRSEKMTLNVKLTITSAIVALISLFVSRVGLTAIIAKGYTALGTVAFPLIIIPLLIFAVPKSLKKFKEQEAAENKE